MSIRTQRSLPFCSRILNELIENGLVAESGLAESTGGRRAHTYALVQDAMYIVAVAMDQLVTRIAILNMLNRELGETRVVALSLYDNREALPMLIKNIENHILGLGISKSSIIGIGIGMPGFVDVVKGVNHSFLPMPEGSSIVSRLEKETGIPVYIDNDSSLIALAESRFGLAKEKKNALVINVGWGIGLGIIVNRELFRGNNGFAGEFSHIPLFTNNKMCSCGKTGCLETETSLLVVAERLIRELEDGKISSLKLDELSLLYPEATSQKIIAAATRGDRLAIEKITEAAYYIGKGAAILIHLFNPELIILSGRGASAGRLWITPIQQAVHEHAIPKIAENTEIRISRLQYQAEIIGAAALVMEHFGKDNNSKIFEKKRSIPDEPDIAITA
ncbi:MAG TPA: ROK family protein [Chitinophagaceae bacterium]|nr:ROK family protein [Chitinophagaceae bacterium]